MANLRLVLAGFPGQRGFGLSGREKFGLTSLGLDVGNRQLIRKPQVTNAVHIKPGIWLSVLGFYQVNFYLA